MKPMRIESLDAYDWTGILRESLAEGHNMVNRLLADFLGGINRFDKPGEVLFAHSSGNAVVAVAGLNHELEPRCPRSGRIWRLFVLPEYRGVGLARGLVEELNRCAAADFDTVTVNVGRMKARGFYEHLGFTPVQHPGIAHIKELGQDQEVDSLPSSAVSIYPGQ